MKTRLILSISIAALLAIGLVGCQSKESADLGPPEPPPSPEAPAAEPMVAVARLEPAAEGGPTGTVTFTEKDGAVTMVAEILGASPGDHGFHLHEVGDCSAADFTSAGGHFNPTEAPHGSPEAEERHAGDFGNVTVAEDGTGLVERTSSMLTVSEGPHSVVGRAVIFHEKTDDLETQPTGAAGARIACGVVMLAGDDLMAEDPSEETVETEE